MSATTKRMLTDPLGALVPQFYDSVNDVFVAIDSGANAASWYTSVTGFFSLIKLAIAVFVGAGSHNYGYVNGVLTTDAWTLFGTTRTKTYTYTGGLLTSETDWV